MTRRIATNANNMSQLNTKHLSLAAVAILFTLTVVRTSRAQINNDQMAPSGNPVATASGEAGRDRASQIINGKVPIAKMDSLDDKMISSNRGGISSAQHDPLDTAAGHKKYVLVKKKPKMKKIKAEVYKPKMKYKKIKMKVPVKKMKKKKVKGYLKKKHY